MKHITRILWAVSLTLIMIGSGFVIVGSGSPDSADRPDEGLPPESPALYDPWPTWTGNTVYHTIPEMEAELDQIVADHSDIVKRISIGKSWQGRDIWAVKVSDNPQIEEADEPEVYFNANHHAREWMTIEVVLYAINFLTDNYGINSTVTDIVNNRQVWFIPSANPDGREFDGSTAGDDPANHHPGLGGWGWRKNCRDNNGDDIFDYTVDGVDPNRNYGYLWGASGATSDPTYDTYGGPSPFSEPETSAIRDFCRQHNFVYAVSYHSYSQLILYPWGWTFENCPDEDMFISVANEMSSRITNTAGSAYPGYIPQKSSGLYPTAGSDDDWLYGELGTCAYTIEVYPNVNDNDAAVTGSYDLFHPRSDKVLPVCQDNIGAIIMLCQAADNRYQFMDHVSMEPEQAELRIEDGTSGSVTINVTDDGHRADSFNLAYTTIPGWTLNLNPGTMNLARNETQPAILDITVPLGETPGTYTIWVNATSQTNASCTASSTVIVNVPWPDDAAAVSLEPFTELGDFPTGQYRMDGTVKNAGEVQVPAFDTNLTITQIGAGSTVTLFQDDMESGTSNWNIVDHDLANSNSLWHQVTDRSSSGVYSWWCGPAGGGNYDPQTIQSLVMAQPISLYRYTNATLDFMSYYSTETYYDFLMVEGSPDNGKSWDYITRYDSSGASWQARSLDLSQFLGSKEFLLRFRFTSDSGTEDIGFWLDDVVITAEDPTESIIYGPVPLSTSGPLDVENAETLSWVYNFIVPGTYRASLQTQYPTDGNPANDIKDVMFYINGSRRLPEFGGVESVVDLGTGSSLGIYWSPALQINDPLTYHVYRFDHAPTEAEVNTTASVWSGTALDYEDSGLTKGNAYNYVVRAEDTLGQMEYNMVVMNATPSLSWFFQIETSGIAGYQNLTSEPLDTGQIAHTTTVPAPGQYMVGTNGWLSETLGPGTGLDGYWNFSVYGNASNSRLGGFLYAKVYRYNSGSPVLLFQTGDDDENVTAFTDPHLFEWSYNATPTSLPAGERILAEIWVNATDGGALNTSHTYVPADPAFAASFWDVDTMPPTGANLNTEYPFTATQDTDTSVSNNVRAASLDPGNFDEIFTWCDVTVAEDPASITSIDLTFEGQGNAATSFDLWALTNSGGWAATGDTIALGAGTDGTLTGTISSNFADYIIGGVLSWGVYQTDSSDLIRVDYLETQVSVNLPEPFFQMEYDSPVSPSQISPGLGIAAGEAYNIDLSGFGPGDWVFISFPIDVSGDIETLLDDNLNGDGLTTWDTAKWYDPQDTNDQWKTFSPSKPVGLNDLATVDNAIGLWVRLTANGGDQNLTTGLLGDYSTIAESVNLYAGWNLVGYPSATARQADITLPAQADMMAVYDGTQPYLVRDVSALNTETMTQGNAYWVHVTADCVWSVNP